MLMRENLVVAGGEKTDIADIRRQKSGNLATNVFYFVGVVDFLPQWRAVAWIKTASCPNIAWRGANGNRTVPVDCDRGQAGRELSRLLTHSGEIRVKGPGEWI